MKSKENIKDKKNALLLLSGGVDSAACLEYLTSNSYLVKSLFIDYGQLAVKQELIAAKKIAKHYESKLKKLEITSSKRYGAGFIMGRNLLLYSIALVEFKYEYGIIASGIHKGTNYADCKPKFLTKVQETYDIYTEGRVRLLTPFINWVKADILQYCEEKEVPINITYSCEIGKEKPCGKCLSCLDLKKYYAGKNN